MRITTLTKCVSSSVTLGDLVSKLAGFSQHLAVELLSGDDVEGDQESTQTRSFLEYKISALRRSSPLQNGTDFVCQSLDASFYASASPDCSLKMGLWLPQVIKDATQGSESRKTVSNVLDALMCVDCEKFSNLLQSKGFLRSFFMSISNFSYQVIKDATQGTESGKTVSHVLDALMCVDREKFWNLLKSRGFLRSSFMSSIILSHQVVKDATQGSEYGKRVSHLLDALMCVDREDFFNLLKSRCFLRSSFMSVSNSSHQVIKDATQGSESGMTVSQVLDALMCLDHLNQLQSRGFLWSCLMSISNFSHQDYMRGETIFSILSPGVNIIIAERTNQIHGNLKEKAVQSSLEIILLFLRKDLQLADFWRPLLQVFGYRSFSTSPTPRKEPIPDDALIICFDASVTRSSEDSSTESSEDIFTFYTGILVRWNRDGSLVHMKVLDEAAHYGVNDTHSDYYETRAFARTLLYILDLQEKGELPYSSSLIFINDNRAAVNYINKTSLEVDPTQLQMVAAVSEARRLKKRTNVDLYHKVLWLVKGVHIVSRLRDDHSPEEAKRVKQLHERLLKEEKYFPLKQGDLIEYIPEPTQKKKK